MGSSRLHHSKSWLLVGIILGLLGLSPPESRALTYYVAKLGNNNNSCTLARTEGVTDVTKRKGTINGGIACLGGGDTLIVGSGTYDEGFGDFPGIPSGAIPIPSGSSSARTTIKSETPRGATITLSLGVVGGDWAGIVTFEHTRQWIAIEGFVLDAQHLRNNTLTLTDISQSRFKDLHLYRAKDSSIKSYGGDNNNHYHNLEISFTAFLNGQSICGHDTCGASPGELCPFSYCHAVYLGTSGGASNNNLFEGGWYHDNDSHAFQTYGSNNTFRGIRIERNTTGVGIYNSPGFVYNNVFIDNGRHISITNASTIIGNTISGFWHGRAGILTNPESVAAQVGATGIFSGHGSLVQNNLILQIPNLAGKPAGRPIGHHEDDTLSATFGGNLCDRASQGCVTIPASPSPVVNAGAGDFHLAAGSAAIGQGLAKASPYNVDAEGNPRPGPNGSTDVGAYESGGASAPVATSLAFSQATMDDFPAGELFSVSVKAYDQAGALFTASAVPVTLAIGTNPAGGTLSGVLLQNTIPATATASFDSLAINNPGTSYTLRATSPGLTTATSDAFTVLPAPPGAPTALQFGVQPTTTQTGATITPPITVRVVDSTGTLVSSTASITLALGATPAGGSLGGTTTQAAVGGTATFANLTVTPANTNYTLVATSAPLTSATSAAFNITALAGVPTHLGFAQQPTSAVVGVALTPAVTVRVLDAGSQVVPSSTLPVTIGLAMNPAGGTLACGPATCTKNAIAGVATFDTLSLNIAGTGYALSATAPGVTAAQSAVFAITPVPAPPTTGTIELGWDYTQGSPLATGFTVAEQPGCVGAFTARPGMPQGLTQTYTRSGLPLGSLTCWRVTAVDATPTASAPSNTVYWTVPVPVAPPTNLAITPRGTGFFVR